MPHYLKIIIMLTAFYDSTFQAEAEKYSGIIPDYRLLKAIALVETNINNKKIGADGERGIMQIMQSTYDAEYKKKYNNRDFKELSKDTEFSIAVGANILADKIILYRNLERGIIGYNGHAGKKTPAGLKYLNKVIAAYKKIVFYDELRGSMITVSIILFSLYFPKKLKNNKK